MAESVVGPWAADKLDRLRKYLHAYTIIMKDQHWCEGFHYIDAFAGMGIHQIRAQRGTRENARQAMLDVAEYSGVQNEHLAFLAGSPRVALELSVPFSSYVFVETNKTRVKELEKLKGEYGNSRKIVIRKQDCNRYLHEKVSQNPKVDWKRNRAVVFLDPFGMQVRWNTIESLAKTGAIEVFLNFPVGMAIQRLLRRNPQQFSAVQRRRLDEYFGSPEWFDVLYKKTPTLFGDDVEEKVQQSGVALVRWYRDHLRTVFKCVSKAALIRNSRRGHLYYLLLATHKRTGVQIANDILSAGEVV